MKKALKIIVFFLILLVCLQKVYGLTKDKERDYELEGFFNQEEDFNVLFFGSSHMYDSIYPMQLWNEYGIVSYNLGSSMETIPTTYYNMLLSLEQTNPKLVVIDGYMCFGGKIYKNMTSYLHKTLDEYPLSYIKYLAIKDLFDEQDMLDKSFEYLFNFSIYHSRWDELTMNDFKVEEEYEKGAKSKVNVAIPNKMSDFNSIEAYDRENLNMKYLRKIIEYCKEKKIEVMVTYMPFPASDEKIGYSKRLQTICDEYSVNYINFLNLDVVNYNTDCYDADSHLNVSGARKVTNYLGQYIMENYEIPNQKKNEEYSFWNQDYNEYVDYKIANLERNANNLNNYLMLLYGEEDIKYEIKISSKKEIENGSTLYYLLENIGNNYEIDDGAFEKQTDKEIKITTWDNRNGKLIDILWW